MFERPRSGERAVLVHIDFAEATATSFARAVQEFQELSASAGAICTILISSKRHRPEPRYFIGSGKAEEIREVAQQEDAELVIFDHELSPSQERNLEALLKCRVLDRTGLILDIFAQRAQSFEGKLQVELAQLRHLSTRLIRGWTHLERQKGGIGLRGPGETQLETDRRLLAERIKQINRRLVKVNRQRDQGRQARRKAATHTVSLVGYTNAGKSTLFNALTTAEVYAADQLFATLDPTLRRLPLPNADDAVLVDTVGFISRLPHELVAAFRATLQETVQASLLLHVIDAADPERHHFAGQVEQVLAEIGADDVPCIRVMNKIDTLTEAEMKQPHMERNADGEVHTVWLSAQQGLGLDFLADAIAERLQGDNETVHGWVRLLPAQARIRARLFTLNAVRDERLNQQGEWLLEVQTSRRNFDQLCHKEDFKPDWLESVAL